MCTHTLLAKNNSKQGGGAAETDVADCSPSHKENLVKPDRGSGPVTNPKINQDTGARVLRPTQIRPGKPGFGPGFTSITDVAF